MTWDDMPLIATIHHDADLRLGGTLVLRRAARAIVPRGGELYMLRSSFGDHKFPGGAMAGFPHLPCGPNRNSQLCTQRTHGGPLPEESHVVCIAYTSDVPRDVGRPNAGALGAMEGGESVADTVAREHNRMARARVQAMVFRGTTALFAYGSAGGGRLRHCFVGGGVQAGETAEAAVLREMAEEARVSGTIVFKVPEPDRPDHATFLVDIGDREPKLGSDPEEADRSLAERQLQALIWLDLDARDAFTGIDRRYFAVLLDECRRRGYEREWCAALRRLLETEEDR